MRPYRFVTGYNKLWLDLDCITAVTDVVVRDSAPGREPRAQFLIWLVGTSTPLDITVMDKYNDNPLNKFAYLPATEAEINDMFQAHAQLIDTWGKTDW